MKHKHKSQIEAVKKANTGKVLTVSHKKRISNGLNAHSDKSIIVAMMTDGRIRREHHFKTCADCARQIGCSRQLVSQCIRRPEVFKSACGWKIWSVEQED